MSDQATENPSSERSSLLRRSLLWVIAVLLALAAFTYQRRTGPTYPLRGTFEIEGKTYRYQLIRSEWTTTDAQVELPYPGEGVKATLYFKRFRTDDPFTAKAMETEEDRLIAALPKQPAAGKLEYYVQLTRKDSDGPVFSSPHVVIRFKDPVPEHILYPHIAMMIIAILLGMRAGLGALFAADSMRVYVWTALIAMTIGGMALGPIVQKYAFGEYWTGFPFGGDWTDNKMLIMWVVWLLAAAAVGMKPKKKEGPGRGMVVVAAVVMTAVYLIPHSIHGSELDYEKIDAGVDPAKAIETGK